MKKSLLIAIAALFVAIGANAQFNRVPQATKFVPQATKVVPQAAPVMMKKAPMDQTERLVANHVKSTVSHRAASDLEGTYILDFANWDGDFTSSSSFTITAETGTAKVISENEAGEEVEVDFDYNLRFDNLSFAGAVVHGFFDETDNTIYIPCQVAGSYSTYGDYRFSGLVTVNGEPYNYGFDVLLVVDEDGTIYNYDFADELAENGWPEGAAISGFWTYLPGQGYLEYGTTMEFYAPNASMGDVEVHLKNGDWGDWERAEYDVHVEDYGSELVVHNFFGLCPLSINIEGETASIATPVRMMNDDFAEEGEDPDYIQLWQWDEEFENIVNPGCFTGHVYELTDGRKLIEFYDTDDEDYIIKDYTKWFMVHSTWGDSGAYWWGEAYGVYLIWGEASGAGINEVNTVNKTAAAKTYNMMGQEVGKDAKGLLIRDGRKYIAK